MLIYRDNIYSLQPWKKWSADEWLLHPYQKLSISDDENDEYRSFGSTSGEDSFCD